MGARWTQVKGRKSHVTRHTSHVTRHTSRVTRHKSCITSHTSHVTRHTSPASICRCSTAAPASPTTAFDTEKKGQNNVKKDRGHRNTGWSPENRREGGRGWHTLRSRSSCGSICWHSRSYCARISSIRQIPAQKHARARARGVAASPWPSDPCASCTRCTVPATLHSPRAPQQNFAQHHAASRGITPAISLSPRRWPVTSCVLQQALRQRQRHPWRWNRHSRIDCCSKDVSAVEVKTQNP